MLRGLLSLALDLPACREALDALAEPVATLRLDVPDAARPYVVAALASAGPSRPLLVVTARPEDAQRHAEELDLFLGEGGGRAPSVLLYPAPELLPFERQAGDEEARNGRLRVLTALAGDPETWPAVVVASVPALAQRVPGLRTFLEGRHTLHVGQRVRVGDLLAHWAALGYALETAAEVPGTASRRGGILDVYPPGAPFPYRIELGGDTIESIRSYVPATQRSLSQVETITVTPAREVLPELAEKDDASRYRDSLSRRKSASKGEAARRTRDELDLLLGGEGLEGEEFYSGLFSTGGLLDYLPDGSVVVLDEPLRVRQAGEEMEERVQTQRRSKEERGELPPEFPAPLWPWPRVHGALEGHSRQLHLEALGAASDRRETGITPSPGFWGRLDTFAESAGRRAREGERVVVLSHHAQRLGEVLREQDIGARVAASVDEPPEPGSVTLVTASAFEGFLLPLPLGPLVLLTDGEVFGRAKKRRPLRRHALRREAFLSELEPGAYVVHVDHGVARFVGSRRVATEHGEREYLTLEYAGGDRLYVPSDLLDRISPYFAPGETAPSLTRLGSQEWGRARDRARRAAREMAQELLSLYAARQVLPGYAFSPDSAWQREMEEAFPFMETPDQLEAIAEVKAGMELPHPLDRLVCGDVGYGKTEVAVRAAFKAVQDGKQAALLCPTTVLAQQHYATFAERLSPFPVKVEVLSRFRTDLEQRQVTEGLRTGAVDIVIGTHRLIQKDISFKDLGLMVIDDEQRFGVAQKERFKQLRREVDVLTMSATPIPRTLYMALAGLRDMSTINTPPELRQPVRTFVSEYSDDLVREAVLRELDRDGQVFFVHNRVRSIDEWASRIQELVPEARVSVGHGQMPEDQLASVMTDFLHRKIDVLVCTTIIEAGLDIPTANTLIAHSPELLGLSQMYQLRGRVGRGGHAAYAYFLVPRGKRLSESAAKRLKAILAHQELGAGFRLAMKDLEIRGAGNILGPEQSGHVHAVGFDLYCRLLEEAVEELRQPQEGEERQPPPPPQASVDLPLPAFIPQEYVPDLAQRLGVYQRLARTTTLQEIDSLGDELRDRFGPLPEEVEHLLYVVRIKVLAGSTGVDSVAREGGSIVLRLREPTGGARPALRRELGAIAHVGDTLLRLPLHGDWQAALQDVLERLAAFRDRALALAGAHPQPGQSPVGVADRVDDTED